VIDARFIRRGAPLIVLLLLHAANACADSKKVRVFNGGFETVWSAAVSAASDGFLSDRVSKEQGTLRFRSGPFRAYRFEVVVIPIGPARTRVEVELRTNRYGIERGAWRDGDRYLIMMLQRIERTGRK